MQVRSRYFRNHRADPFGRFDGYLLLIALLSMLGSCIQPSAQLTESGTIVTFEKDSIYHWSQSHLATYNGEAVICCLLPNAAGIHLYSTKGGAPIHRVPFDRIQSHDLIDRLFRVVSPDSIFLISTDNDLLMINESGSLITQWKLQSTREQESPPHVIDLPQNNILYDQGRLYITTHPFQCDLQSPEGRKACLDHPREIMIDLRSPIPQWSTISAAAPEQYLEANFRDEIPSRCLNDEGQLVYSYPISSQLLVASKDSPQWFDAVSLAFREAQRFHPGDPPDYYEIIKYITVEGRYRQIHFDPFRKLYYRIYDHPLDELEKADGTVRSYADKPWSIIILNKQLEVLNEISFDPQIHPTFEGITPEGILISKRVNEAVEHPEQLTLSLFKIALQ